MPCVQSCEPICGASRTATAQELGGFMISAPLPEISQRLLAASSQVKTSLGSHWTSFLPYSRTCLTASDLTMISPFELTSCAPCAWKSAPTQSTESPNWLSGRPNGTPALAHFSAATRNVSQVQLSALGGAPAGYMACTSIPACCFMRSMREQGGLSALMTAHGTATHLPFTLPRYSAVRFGAPLVFTRSAMTSSTGSSSLAWSEAAQPVKTSMSWPARAAASAATVSWCFAPIVVM